MPKTRPGRTPSPAAVVRGRLGGATAAANMTPEQRTARARVAAYDRWAREPDRVAATRAAREAQHRELYAEADRQGITDPVVREQMANAAQAEKMARMRLRAASAPARRRRAAARRADRAAVQDGEAS
jgi:hypothetical protein